MMVSSPIPGKALHSFISIKYLLNGKMESSIILILKINFEFSSPLLCTENSSIIPSPGPTNICQASLTCFYQTFFPKLKMSPRGEHLLRERKGKSTQRQRRQGSGQRSQGNWKACESWCTDKKGLPKARCPSAISGEQLV